MSDTRRAVPLWRNVSFTLMWTSTAASGFGDRMIMLAALALLGGLVEGIDNSSGIQAGTQFWFFLPYILFSVPAGWLADRLPRKWLMLGCDEARGLILLLAFILVGQATGPADIPADHHWKVHAILFAVGVLAATFNPTRNAVIPQLVDTPHLQAANGIILGINIIASLIGMIVGTRIIDPDSATSVRTGLLTAAGFYMVSGTFFAFLKLRGHAAAPREAGNRSLLQATQYILKHRRIALLIALNVLVWSTAAAVSSALIGIGGVHYGMSGETLAEYFGLMYAALGAGMLTGAGIVCVIGSRRESDVIYLKAFLMVGACILVLALVPVKWVGYVATFGVGVFGNIVIVTIMTMLQSLSPNYIRGRVMGANSMANTLFSVATYYIIWQMPDADVMLIRVLYVLGPALMAVGLYGLIKQLFAGPMPTKIINMFWHMSRTFVLTWHGVQWQGRGHIPREGAVLLAANHTAGTDPLLMQSAVPRMVRWVMISTYKFRILNFFWNRIDPIVLDEQGAEMSKVRQIIKSLKAGDMVGLFPEGRLQRDVRELHPFQAGIGMIAQRTGAWIVPVWIEGTPQTKSMFWHFAKPSRSRVTFGKAYKADKDATHEEVVEDLRQRMIALASESEPRRSDAETA